MKLQSLNATHKLFGRFAHRRSTQLDQAWRNPQAFYIMRLATEEQSAIRRAISQADANAVVYLFGSRADDTAKGGDIDLLVISKKIDIMAKLDILAQLHQQLGERKVDIAIYPDGTRPFPKMVLQAAVPL